MHLVRSGHTVKRAYLSDGNHNNQMDIVIYESRYQYVPDGDPSAFVVKQSGTIPYPGGSAERVLDTERRGSGLARPLLKMAN